jgi:hypothetical protein
VTAIDMEAPPIWLLDFDGVINTTSPQWGEKPIKVWSPPSRYALGQTYRVRFAPSLIGRIKDVAESGLVEVRWASTWNGDTDALLAMTGLDFPAAFEVEPNMHWTIVGARKRLAAQHVLEREGRRLIWTDDVEVPFTWELAHAETCRDGRALLIRPKERQGLLPAHLDEIDRYVGLLPVDEEVAA